MGSDSAVDSVEEDVAVLRDVVRVVTEVGALVASSYRPAPRPRDFADIGRLLDENDELAQGPLRAGLTRVRPGAGWVEDEDESGPLPPGEWWVTDAVEGNINKAHGIPEFCTSATLVRDDRPVITAVHVPLLGDTYTAVAGGGARCNGEPLRVSDKTSLSGAFVMTAQNGPHEASGPARRLGRTVAALLERNAIVRVAPPPTLQLLHVAAGRSDLFWQFGAARSGLVAGALLVAEAGGRVTDTRGRSWGLDSEDVLAAAPGLLAPMVELLAVSGPTGRADGPTGAGE